MEMRRNFSIKSHEVGSNNGSHSFFLAYSRVLINFELYKYAGVLNRHFLVVQHRTSNELYACVYYHLFNITV